MVGQLNVPESAERPSQFSGVCPTSVIDTLPSNFRERGSNDAPGMKDNRTAPLSDEMEAARKFDAWLLTLTPASATSSWTCPAEDSLVAAQNLILRVRDDDPARLLSSTLRVRHDPSAIRVPTSFAGTAGLTPLVAKRL